VAHDDQQEYFSLLSRGGIGLGCYMYSHSTVIANHQSLISQQSQSAVPGWVRCCRRRTRRPKARTSQATRHPRPVTSTLRLPIPLPS